MTMPPATRAAGETIRGAVAALEGIDVGALLVNCSVPEAVTAAMGELAQAAAGRPFGGYANGFQPELEHGVDDGTDVPDAREDLTPDKYAGFAMAWREAGARLIGGCCEVGPAHIAQLRRRLDAHAG